MVASWVQLRSVASASSVIGGLERTGFDPDHPRMLECIARRQGKQLQITARLSPALMWAFGLCGYCKQLPRRRGHTVGSRLRQLWSTGKFSHSFRLNSQRWESRESALMMGQHYLSLVTPHSSAGFVPSYNFERKKQSPQIALSLIVEIPLVLEL